MTNAEYTPTLYTLPNGAWRVAALTSNGTKVVTDPAKYANEATAALAAKRWHNEKPFINYVAVRG